MPTRMERRITLTGTGGPNQTSILVNTEPSVGRVLSTVKLRYESGSHVFTAFAARLGMFPKNLAGLPLDPQGRVTVPQNCYTEVPAERIAYNLTSATPGAASPLQTFLVETIPPEDRPVINGPFGLTVQWTVSGGTTSTIVVELEFDDSRGS